jgi:hypothetical protein
MQVVIFSSPNRQKLLSKLLKELKGFDVHIISDAESFGKKNFWSRWEMARAYCLNSPHDNYLILPDDIQDIDLFTIGEIYQIKERKPFVCSVISDGRSSCWGSIPNRLNDFKYNGYNILDLGFFDCGGLTNRTTLKLFKVDKVSDNWFKKASSSGVGSQITNKLKALRIPMYLTSPSLSFHGDHNSVMHPKERKQTPLISTTKKMKVVIGIATFKGRESYLQKTLESLQGQCDEIVVYDNEVNPDLADNGKFWQLQNLKANTYFLSCDDDIIYPPTYVQDMVEAINKHNCIITHHGRVLKGLDRSYYKGHESFACKQMNPTIRTIDVAGTGVTGFNTNYFHPKQLHKAKDLKMSDIIFSLEVAKQGKKIIMPQRPNNYFIIQDVPVHETIYGMHVNKETRQIELSNEIWKLKYQKE